MTTQCLGSAPVEHPCQATAHQHIIRIKELHNWSQSNQYQRIMKGDYVKA